MTTTQQQRGSELCPALQQQRIYGWRCAVPREHDDGARPTHSLGSHPSIHACIHLFVLPSQVECYAHMARRPMDPPTACPPNNLQMESASYTHQLQPTDPSLAGEPRAGTSFWLFCQSSPSKRNLQSKQAVAAAPSGRQRGGSGLGARWKRSWERGGRSGGSGYALRWSAA